MSRPKTKIDWELVDDYLRAHCNGKAIAGILGIHYNTFYNLVEETFNCSFTDYADTKKTEGVSLMEKSLFDSALKNGGVDRIFWLKNKAEWRDRRDVEYSGSVTYNHLQIDISDVSDEELDILGKTVKETLISGVANNQN